MKAIAARAYLDCLIEMNYLRSRIKLEDVQKVFITKLEKIRGYRVRKVGLGELQRTMVQLTTIGLRRGLVRNKRLRIAKCSSRAFMAICEQTMAE
jgi:hypothetical protein